MPSKPRVSYAGAVQHVAVNGNNRQPMFLSDADRRHCLSLLGECADRYGWEVLSYCLMDTHWHLLVRTPEPTLSNGMRRLNSCYSQAFNRRHDRSGHSIRHPEAWIWSSYRAELGVVPAPTWLHPHWSVALHGSDGHLRRFVAAGMAEPGARWTPGSDPTLTPPRPEE